MYQNWWNSLQVWIIGILLILFSDAVLIPRALQCLSPFRACVNGVCWQNPLSNSILWTSQSFGHMPSPLATCRIVLLSSYLGALRLHHQRALCYFCMSSLPVPVCLRTYFIQSYFLWYSWTQVAVVILLKFPYILLLLSCVHPVCSPSLTWLTSSGTFTPLMAQKSL